MQEEFARKAMADSLGAPLTDRESDHQELRDETSLERQRERRLAFLKICSARRR